MNCSHSTETPRIKRSVSTSDMDKYCILKKIIPLYILKILDIANVFFRAGEIEAWGRGIERIGAACKGAGCLEPHFDYDGGGLWTVFYFGEEHVNTSQKTNQKTIQKLSQMQEDILHI